MDSYLEYFSNTLKDIINAKEETNNLILNFDDRLERLALRHYPEKEPLAQQQNKKKPRGRNDSNDTASIGNASETSTYSQSGANGPTRPSAEVVVEDTAPLRPIRTAKAKPGSMKEPALNTKMRRDAFKSERTSGNNDDELTTPAQTAAIPSTAATTSSSSRSNSTSRSRSTSRTAARTTTQKSAQVTSTTANNTLSVDSMPVVRVKLEKLSINAIETGTRPKDKTSSGSGKRKTPDLGADVEVTETTQRSSATKKGNDSIEIIHMEVTTFNVSDDDEQRVKERDIMPPPATIPPPATNKKDKKSVQAKKTDENSRESSKSVRSTRSKQVKVVQVKQEPIDPDERDIPSIPNEETTTTSSSTAGAKSKSKSSRAPSGESIYEDAVSGPSQSAVSIAEAAILNLQSLQTGAAFDATFVTTTTENGPEYLSPRPTYVISKEQDSEQACDATFHVPNETVKNSKATSSTKSSNQTAVATTKNRKVSEASSIMTEDDSDTGSPVISQDNNFKKPLPVLKTTKELFSPYQQKSTKQKVEAFEKLQSPIPLRQTRTKTRAKQAAADSDSSSIKSTATDLQKPLRTNSATRYVHGANTTKSSSMIKASSCDDIRKKAQALNEEKKKKRDEKIRQAQLHREAQEREKLEKIRKAAEEKERRMRAAYLLKQSDEQAKLREQKRKEAEREQMRKEQMARKERDNLKILAEQKALADKLRANQRAAEILKQQRSELVAYTFDMLDSGDSTDYEDKDNRERPSPPEWSRKHNRLPLIAEESKIDASIIDKFFSVEPREVDLREIFPKIDDKYLRRNSSAIWNTPPRYSMMPKY